MAEHDLPLVRHLDAISKLRQLTKDFKAGIVRELAALRAISPTFPALPYLEHQLLCTQKTLEHVEKMWDLSFSEIYALQPANCAYLVERVVAKYEENAAYPTNAIRIDNLNWLV